MGNFSYILRVGVMLLYIASNSEAIKGKVDSLITLKKFKLHLGNNIINKVK